MLGIGKKRLLKVVFIVGIAIFALSCSSSKNKDKQGGTTTAGKVIASSSVIVGGESKVPSATDHNDRVYGDTIIIGVIGQPFNLLPLITSDTLSHNISEFIYNSLLKVEADMSYSGDLAKSWRYSEDGKRLIFELYDNIKWHDGAMFTAADVVFTYELLSRSIAKGSKSSHLSMVSKIYAEGDYTVVIECKEVYSPAISLAVIKILPKHLLEDTTLARSSLQRFPIGTGPYRFNNWVHDSYINLVAYDDYHKGRAYVDAVQFKFYKDFNDASIAIKMGALDILHGGKGELDDLLLFKSALPSISPDKYGGVTDDNSTDRLISASTDSAVDELNTYESNEPNEPNGAQNGAPKDSVEGGYVDVSSHYILKSYPSESYTYVAFNLNNKILKDVEVRRALAYATPYGEIMERTLYSTRANSIYPTSSIWYDSSLDLDIYNLDEAKKILKEAGWELNKQGILEKDKVKFKISIDINSSDTKSTIAELLSKEWSKLGVDVNINKSSWENFIKNKLDKRSFEVSIMSWNHAADPDQSAIWHSRGCDSKEDLNYICFKSDAVDEALEEAQLTYTIAERKKLYGEMQADIKAKQPYIFLFEDDLYYIVTGRLSGLNGNKSLFNNVHLWYVEKGKQKYTVVK